MKIVLYMATTIDGLVAKKDGDSDWVSPLDTENFETAMKETGCVVVGRKTFDQYQGELYPVEGVTNIVLSRGKNEKVAEKNVFYAESVEEAIKIAEKNGHEKMLLIGGGHINAAFLKAGLIDEIILSVHPKILGEGIKLFEGVEMEVELKLLEMEKVGEELVRLRYEVKK